MQPPAKLLVRNEHVPNLTWNRNKILTILQFKKKRRKKTASRATNGKQDVLVANLGPIT